MANSRRLHARRDRACSISARPSGSVVPPNRSPGPHARAHCNSIADTAWHGDRWNLRARTLARCVSFPWGPGRRTIPTPRDVARRHGPSHRNGANRPQKDAGSPHFDRFRGNIFPSKTKCLRFSMHTCIKVKDANGCPLGRGRLSRDDSSPKCRSVVVFRAESLKGVVVCPFRRTMRWGVA
jgi:hypothetical protein